MAGSQLSINGRFWVSTEGHNGLQIRSQLLKCSDGLHRILLWPRSHDSGYEVHRQARRWRVTRLAEVATIQAHVVTFDDQTVREAANHQEPAKVPSGQLPHSTGVLPVWIILLPASRSASSSC